MYISRSDEFDPRVVIRTEKLEIVVHRMRDHTYVYLNTKVGPNLGTSHIYIIGDGWVRMDMPEHLTVPPESPIKTAIEVWAKMWSQHMNLEDFIRELGLDTGSDNQIK